MRMMYCLYDKEKEINNCNRFVEKFGRDSELSGYLTLKSINL